MLDSLRHFLLIVEHGTFTEAAKRAHITQPGLSASIRRLEEQLGAAVLERKPRGARLTAEGQALLPHARAALAAVAEGHRSVQDVLGLRAGELRVGGGAVACTYLLPTILAEFRDAFPDVTVRLREVSTPQVPLAVDAAELDLGIAEGPQDPALSDPLGEDPLIFVGSPELKARWHSNKGLAPRTPFVTFPPSTSLRRSLDRVLPDAEVVSELTNIAAIQGWVRAGIGASLLPRAAAATDLELGRVVELTDPRTPPPRILVLRHRGRDRLSPAALELRRRLLTPQ
ncbi:MAG: LysR family transcriptional regulator [Myxococcota bacterium]